MDIQTILVPVDFSVCSLGVVRQATALAGKLGARIELVHVGDLPPGITPDTRIVADGHREAAGAVLSRDALARMAPFEAVARGEGVPVGSREVFGPIASTLLQAVDDAGADLVVMGTHGRSGLARIVLGSVAEAVVHGATVPVMLIRRQPRPECGRDDCDWCAHGGRSLAEDRIDAEQQG
ncbi:MAG: universal stress protein [Myxococcota bacterium]